MQTKFKKIYNITFSPTGSSTEVAEQILNGFKGEKIKIDLCEIIDEEIQIEQDAICIFSVPCYGGRIPKTAGERMQEIHGVETPSIVCVTFGNRAFEDALLELSDLVCANGFKVVAGCTAVTEHNIMHIYGKGRPDESDKKELQNFGRVVCQKLEARRIDKPDFPGNYPYKEWQGKTAPIIVDENVCESCGLCAGKCPVNAISPDGRNVDKSICISCMRCIKICPKKCRTVSKDYVDGLIAIVGAACESRKENQFYL